jgi:hypothetical protein
MNYKVVTPSECNPEKIIHQKILLPFEPVVVEFIGSLSREILTNSSFRDFPEMIAMAYWMREANLRRLEKDFFDKKKDRLWIGRGIVFHIAPANVDSVFVYSWFLSMMAGNINIIRVSSRTGRQIEILLEAVNTLCRAPKFRAVTDRFMVIRYEHDEEITGFFSLLCDVRVIWGGDSTVRSVRRIPLKTTAAELTFADKFSLCLIKSGSFLEDGQKDRIIDAFYNDAYWFGQLACSSPRLVVWIGTDEESEQARGLFWRMLEKKVLQKMPQMSAAAAIDKLVAEYSVAVLDPLAKIEKSETSLINRVLLGSNRDIVKGLHCGGGLFYELKLESINQLAEGISRKEQTVGVFGFDKAELTDFINEKRPQGIDRFVSVGSALNFSPIWDGYDLLREFCREIELDIRYK